MRPATTTGRKKGDDNSPGVDLEFGMNIGYTGEGEWQMFTLDVQDAGTYAFDLFRSVNNGNGGYYSLEVDGVPTNSVYMINDNDWAPSNGNMLLIPKINPNFTSRKENTQ